MVCLPVALWASLAAMLELQAKAHDKTGSATVSPSGSPVPDPSAQAAPVSRGLGWFAAAVLAFLWAYAVYRLVDCRTATRITLTAGWCLCRAWLWPGTLKSNRPNRSMRPPAMAKNKSGLDRRSEIRRSSRHHATQSVREVLRRVAEESWIVPSRAEKALADLSGEFKQWIVIESDRLAAAHAAILKDGFSDTRRDELFRAAHDIKGDAATFGFPSAGAAAKNLCQSLSTHPTLPNCRANHRPYHINAIQAIVLERTKLDTISMASELSRRLRQVADEYLARVNHDRPEHLEAIMAPSIAPTD